MDLFMDRVYGCAIGAVVGDALGMPLEFGLPSAPNQLITEMTPGRLPAGTFTDDTEMALALAASLIHAAPLDPNDLANRFLSWADSNPPDIGIQTRSVLTQIKHGKTWKEAKQWINQTKPDAAGNGSAMRCWPVALAHWNHWEQIKKDTILQSEITHPNPDCISACIFINTLIYDGLQGSDLSNSINLALKTSDFSIDFLQRLQQAPFKTPSELINSGWIQHTLESVVWALKTTTTFVDAVVQVINLGNDADTAGTIIGAIAGAYYGQREIPAAWQNGIIGSYPPLDPIPWNLTRLENLALTLIQLNSNNH